MNYESIKEHLKKFCSPNISAYVVDKNSKLLEVYMGTYTGQESKIITEETVFNVGSVTKIITGALIIKLLEQGKLTLYDDVKQYCNNFKFEHVNILQLLTHTAGYGPTSEIEWPKKGQKEDYLNKIYSIEELSYKPGQKCSYFTFGYSILMDIIEKVAECSMEEFAQSYLFRPLAMKSTTFDTIKLQPGTYTIPMKESNDIEDKWFGQLDITGDSGLYSNCSDLVKFGQMILNNGIYDGGEIFSRPAIKLMLREITNQRFGRTPNFWVKTPNDLNDAVDIDIHRCFSDFNSPHAVLHNGFSGCLFMIDPFYDICICIVSNNRQLNSDGRNYKKILNGIMSQVIK